MPINSRQKGARGERALRDRFREAGYTTAFRTQQYCGAKGDSDITVPGLEAFHFESKCVEAGNLYNWLEQAQRDCSGHGIVPDGMPIVCHKRNGKEWVSIMPLTVFFDLLKRAGFGPENISEK